MKKEHIAGVFGVLLLVCVFYFRSTKRTADGVENSALPLHQQPSPPPKSIQDRTSIPAPDSRNTPADPEWPASAKQAVGEALAGYKGKELERQLYLAAAHYSQLGIDAVAEFCLALPPGSIGGEALKRVARGAKGYEVEMIGFLKSEQEALSSDWVWGALFSLVTRWKGADPEGALHGLAQSPALSRNEKARLLNSILLRPPRDWEEGQPYPRIISFVDGLTDGELQQALKSNGGYIAASFRHSGAAEAIAALPPLGEGGDPRPLTNTLANVIGDLDDPSPALQALEASDLPMREDVFVRSYKEWISEDVNSALEQLAAVNDANLRDLVIKESLPVIQQYDPEVAKRWLDSIQNDALRKSLMNKVGPND